MKSYEFENRTRTYFGNKCVRDALKKEKETIGDRTLLVTTGGSLERFGYLDELKNILECQVFIYDRVHANPDVDEIREAVLLGKENNVSSVIGFGGGSSIDAAKAAAVGIVSEIDVEDFLLQGLSPTEDTLPIIAIPTTSGTGSELSQGAIISSREKKIKSGIRGERVCPVVAIVDPTYTFSLPFSVTMETGFDVFAHAVESYCSVSTNSYSDMLSEKAIKIVGEALPCLGNNLDDHEARESMSFASHIVGYNVRNIGNCLPHRMQYPVGIVTGSSHGAGLIALYPAWMKYEYTVNKERIDQVLDWLGCDADKPEVQMRQWLKKLKITQSLEALGCNNSPEELAGMVAGNLKNDRLAEVPDIITTIYKESM